MSLSLQPINPAGKVLGSLLNPRFAAYAGICATALMAWAFLLTMLAGMGQQIALGAAGPGMGALQNLLGSDKGSFAHALYLSLCTPSVQAAWLAGQAGIWTGFVFLVPMWFAMSLAMMLPAAAPMVSAYMEIADTARARGIAIISPMILIAGYLALWLVFSVAAAALQWRLTGPGGVNDAMVLTNPVAVSSVLLAAGLYQLSGLKQACLVKCRAPLPYFLSRWSETRHGVFKMGLTRGISCLSCCWALMAVMFAAGVMNVIWMAAVTIIVLLEKTCKNPAVVSRLTGAALLAWAAMTLARSWI